MTNIKGQMENETSPSLYLNPLDVNWAFSASATTESKLFRAFDQAAHRTGRIETEENLVIKNLPFFENPAQQLRPIIV